MNKITSTFGRQLLHVKAKSPTGLFVVGVAGVVATAVLASRATMKMDELLNEADAAEERIESLKGTDEELSEDQIKELLQSKTRLAIRIAKAYAPAVGCGIVAVGALTSSHIILTRRHAGVVAAYAAVDQGFRDYRKRVRDEFGDDKDKEFRFGAIDREMAVDTDDGVAVKTVRVADPGVAERGNGRSIYAVVFDEGNKNWQPAWTHNRMFISQVLVFAQRKLEINGHLFLNEVYDLLGMERTAAGAVVGWVYDGDGDGFVDFGLTDNTNEDARLFVNGDERSVWLDPNVDGIIYDKLGARKGSR